MNNLGLENGYLSSNLKQKLNTLDPIAYENEHWTTLFLKRFDVEH